MLPYECSWAYEEEYRRKHGRNPELLIIGNPPRGRKYNRNHPLYVRRGKKYIPYDAARLRIAFKRRKSGKSRTARTAVQYAEQRLGRYPMYHGIPDVDAGWRKITSRQRGKCVKRGKMPYIKMGGRKLHMTDLVKKYRNMKKAAEVWRGHRHYKAGKVVK